MNLKAEREAIATTLAAGSGLTAFAFVPANPIPPLAMVLPGSPYLEGGDVYGSKTLRADVWLVLPGLGDNQTQSDSLDTHIEAAVAALEDDDLAIENVGQPIEWKPDAGGMHLVSIISISTQIAP
ncbi:hypothetical protein LQ938_09700 [Microbacterium sp. cx-55]|uniref:hypothetical protein n=1 Tax=Microbacterium sp. cx-55 TaxID=2875948 RepID=UPI001CC0272A|nr:hypothetical protein [Microbacterium sp. cx-55]MBZ4485965.1 hypothetical protein [Microbacterium sp. cx-55]UGB34161.1 hypothetical protein LQ938_09700 [Microbacterium sp. cx-55]